MVAAPAMNVQGFTGSVDQTSWARMSGRMGVSPYSVIHVNDLLVTATTGDRTVMIQRTKAEGVPANTPPGGAIGWGVMCEFHAASTLSLPAVESTGSRWDLIVLRRNWSTKTCSLEIVPGNATRAIPLTRNQNPGILDDQPLALIEVRSGSTAIHGVVDLRCWVEGGRLVVNDSMAMQYMGLEGGQAYHKPDGATIRNVEIAGNLRTAAIVGAKHFSNDASIIQRNLKHYQTGYPSTAIATRTIGEITATDPGYPYHLAVQFAFEFVEYGDRWDLQALTDSGHFMVQAIGGGYANGDFPNLNGTGSYRNAMGFSPQRHTGNMKVVLRALHVGPWGNSGRGWPFLIGPFNSYFRVLQIPA